VKIALSEISTPGASFAEDVAAYAAAGFDGIGIWEFKLPQGEDEASLRMLRASGLGAANCVPAVPSLLQLALPALELVLAHLTHLGGLHQNPSPRVTMRVLIESLCAASRSALRASASGTPSISYRMRPGFTTITQPSGAPLPLPIRVSCGFLV